MSFLARYEGVCAVCKDEIEAGQQIEPAEGGYRHLYCVPRPPARVGQICPSCFMEMPLTGLCPCREG